MFPREAETAEHLDRRAAELRERLARIARSRVSRRDALLRRRPRPPPSTRSTRRPVRARPCAACPRTGAAPLGMHRSACRTGPAPWRTPPSAPTRALAAPTPSTTDATARRSTVRATARQRRSLHPTHRGAGRPRLPGPTRACLRDPSTVGIGSTTTPAPSAGTAKTPRRPVSSVAVTTNRSAAAPSATCTFSPSSTHSSSCRRPRVDAAGGDQAYRAPSSNSATVPMVEPSASPGNNTSRSCCEPASSTSETAPIADDAYGLGHTRAPELFEHDRGIDHARPSLPATRSAGLVRHQQTDHAELDQTPPHIVVTDRRNLVLLANVRPDRRAIREEPAYRRTQQLLIGREIEVHRGGS